MQTVLQEVFVLSRKSTLKELQEAMKVRVQSARDLGYFGGLSGSCYLFSPEKSSITPEDIAKILSRTPRWGGRSKVFYSVAEHCLHVSSMCSNENRLLGLLHDAPEAYLGDVISPLKRRLGALYHELEENWAWEIGHRLGVGSALVDLPEEVTRMDLLALEIERHDLCPRDGGWAWWGHSERPNEPKLVPMGSTFQAEQAWLTEYYYLTKTAR